MKLQEELHLLLTINLVHSLVSILIQVVNNILSYKECFQMQEEIFKKVIMYEIQLILITSLFQNKGQKYLLS